MNDSQATIAVNVDVTNPGQYFACCGLLEIADRTWPGAMGWFEEKTFCVEANGDLETLIDLVRDLELIQVDADDKTASPIRLNLKNKLCLDWWHDDIAGGKKLKVWAGTMESFKIARAMQFAMRDERFHSAELFDVGVIAYDPDQPKNKVEPYYFDARRAPNAHSRDVGFSPNTLGLTTTAYPAVELFCLIGLQRCLPAKPERRGHVYHYHTWTAPAPPCLAAAIVPGKIPWLGLRRLQFENWYRTGQKKHQAFRPATPVI